MDSKIISRRGLNEVHFIALFCFLQMIRLDQNPNFKDFLLWEFLSWFSWWKMMESLINKSPVRFNRFELQKSNNKKIGVKFTQVLPKKKNPDHANLFFQVSESELMQNTKLVTPKIQINRTRSFLNIFMKKLFWKFRDLSWFSLHRRGFG